MGKLLEHIRATYHDPCHLGRHGMVYEEPRNILKHISNLEFVEMVPNRQFSICCGAGGGLKLLEGNLAVKIASEKLRKIMNMEVDALVSACPFCKYNFVDAVNRQRIGVKIYDVVELVAKVVE